MKVKLKTIMADSTGCYQPCSIIDVDKKEAKALVDGGFADYAEVIELEPAENPELLDHESEEPEEFKDQPAKKKGKK